MKRFTRIRLRLLRSLLVILFVPPSADTVLAYSIEQVTVLPAGTITSNDPVTLEVLIVTPQSPPHLYQPTEVVVTGTDIRVDIFPDSEPFDQIDYLTETVALGTLEPGIYRYTIDLYPLRPKGWGTRWATGIFSVVADAPIPTVSAWGLTVMTLLVLTAGTLMSRRKPAAWDPTTTR